MIIREAYLKQIRPFYNSDLIKIITGIRRCGKSIVLSQIRDELSQNSDNIIFLDFEDKETESQLPTWKHLLDYVEKNRKEGLCYVFLDEIQAVEEWAEAVKTLRVRNCSVFITGSNSKLLSGEFFPYLSVCLSRTERICIRAEISSQHNGLSDLGRISEANRISKQRCAERISSRSQGNDCLPGYHYPQADQ